MEEIKGDDYNIFFNNDNKTVEFHGSIRLRGTDDYKEISNLLNKAYEVLDDEIILDFRHLEFLNSSGINTISKFIINARKQDKLQVKVLGNKDIYWQNKSLKNLQRLWPKITIDIN